ncbi:NADPH:quinone reductase-like Zn-dependent oxidoreductase [Thermocatellispora tengchongensis]|uniref:NADPH:quinone reductase-like Zn-dependent oxidoreductase n=1 Tax=Thermocatellispora tengchongensis TaxID=1073253 RepID=A0A840P248_9ACTN|nr:zinc-binding dehydrogenase [Thermocatellispora tengchongensis]MBB5131540.1 NADPH:quinone reductase-like Zn-dependent oxidoreductase [Thermocatellispora tengchongensis]
MKAGIVRAWGGPEAVRIEEVPDPVPGPGQVLVRLRAAGLNRADVIIREGGFPEAPCPIILGVEGAGEVADPGDRAYGLEAGQKVLLSPMIVCGACAACRAGADNACPSLKVIGEHMDGTYAQYIAVPRHNVLPAPANLGHVELAAAMTAYMTAWHMLATRAAVAEGETVLIAGAGSGVGSAAVQVAKLLGARVIATTGTPDKERRLREIGADEVIDYRRTPEFHEAVRDLTGGRGADVAHDSVGRATFQRSILALRHGGRLVCMGSHTGARVELDLWNIYRREITILGAHTAGARDIAEFLPHLAGGALRPLVDSVFPLERAADAQARLVSSERFGKVVLTID